MVETVIITGEMRSGTSLCAQLLHHLGFFAGLYLTCPIPPRWRSDWEDPWAVDLVAHEKPIGEDFFKKWALSKKKMSERMGFGGKILLKSPFIALHLNHAMGALPKAFVIVTKRDAREIEKSLKAHPWLDPEDNVKIRTALARHPFAPDYVFDLARWKENASQAFLELCDVLSIDQALSDGVLHLLKEKELV